MKNSAKARQGYCDFKTSCYTFGSIASNMFIISLKKANAYYDAMEARLRKFICPVPASKTLVVKAALGDHSGFIGAAALLFQ